MIVWIATLAPRAESPRLNFDRLREELSENTKRNDEVIHFWFTFMHMSWSHDLMEWIDRCDECADWVIVNYAFDWWTIEWWCADWVIVWCRISNKGLMNRLQSSKSFSPKLENITLRYHMSLSIILFGPISLYLYLHSHYFQSLSPTPHTSSWLSLANLWDRTDHYEWTNTIPQERHTCNHSFD